jgi:hypothetical protein
LLNVSLQLANKNGIQNKKNNKKTKKKWNATYKHNIA